MPNIFRDLGGCLMPGFGRETCVLYGLDWS
jgi:hypothetical protein